MRIPSTVARIFSNCSLSVVIGITTGTPPALRMDFIYVLGAAAGEFSLAETPISGLFAADS